MFEERYVRDKRLSNTAIKYGSEPVLFVIGASYDSLKTLAKNLVNNEQRLVIFYRLAIFNQNGFDLAGLVCFDLIQQFHRLDDA